MTYALINKMTAKSGKRDEVVSIMVKSGVAFNDNPNCLLYLINIDKNDNDVLWIEDLWTDQESHSSAMSDDKMQEYIKEAMPLLEGMPEQVEIELKGGKPNFNKDRLN